MIKSHTKSTIKGRDCAHCQYYYTVPLASPGGWCKLHPSKSVNTDDFSVCSEFEDRLLPAFSPRYIAESWEEIITDCRTGDLGKYHVGDIKYLELDSGEKVLCTICCIDKEENNFEQPNISWITRERFI